MNMPFPSRGQVEFTRTSYPPGTRIVLSSVDHWYYFEASLKCIETGKAEIP